jgi:glycosyltransferase involved in cell wall biosynthesis
MLSIIICSVKKDTLERAIKNIRETAGVPSEVIAIDNSSNQYGICAAYNKGAAKANYPFLCFLHEDIEFTTYNWGQIVCELLSCEQTGMIGVAGGDSMSIVPSTWSVPAISNEINILQLHNRSTGKWEHILKTNTLNTNRAKRVLALDGVFLCTRKNVFAEFQFDEFNFPGFHGYDVDYSFQVGSKYDLLVTFDILIRHYSQGNADRKWMETVFDFNRKWKNRLPAFVYSLSKNKILEHHWRSLQVFIAHLSRLQYKRIFILKMFLRYSFTYFHLPHFLYTLRYTIKKITGKTN